MSGTIPPALLQLPAIDTIVLRGSAQSISLPATVSPTLRVLRLSGLNISSTIPSTWTNLDSLEQIEMENDDLSCPLPQWLLNRIGAQNHALCAFKANLFKITSGKICGQIALRDLRCQLTPVIDAERAVAKVSTPQHSFGDSTTYVELNDTRMFIYGVAERTGRPFKGDYVVVDFQTFSINSDSFLPKLVEVLGWGPTLRKSNSANLTYTTDIILSNNALMEVYFYLDHPQAPSGVKFGFTIRRNASLPDSEQPLLWPNDTGVTFVLSTSFTLRQQHSGLEPLYCDVPPPSFSAFADCRSDVFTEGITYEYDSGGCLYSVGEARSINRSYIRFSYPTCYESDGAFATVDGAYADQWCSGFGSSNFLGRLKNSTSITKFSGEAGATQYSVLTASFSFKNFSTVLDYDPDVSISLLFDPDESPSSPPQVVSAESLNFVGIAVGVSVAVVVVAGLIVLLAVPSVRQAIFPFAGHESVKDKPVTLDTEDDQTRGARWATVQPRNGSLRNVDS
eukprot:TRINITY_DN10188_c0_g1_i1.p1 TRINITY_DN10188_c0_g1~~TRINITY_DN10188_c0_g1_i1.p1  ORF type:complete len:567 (-),score=65.52 TRINITY_DN10188_c0_g1_i1:99-1622(-)